MLGYDFLPGEPCLRRSSPRLLCPGEDRRIGEGSAGLTAGVDRTDGGITAAEGRARWGTEDRERITGETETEGLLTGAGCSSAS